MSRAQKFTLTPLVQKAKEIWRWMESRSQIKAGRMPDVGLTPCFSSLNIPPLPNIVTEIPSLSVNSQSARESHDMAGQSRRETSRRLLAQQNIFDEKHLHIEVVELLEKTGHTIKETKVLPSGERLISISDMPEGFFQKSTEYSYVRRDRGRNEPNIP